MNNLDEALQTFVANVNTGVAQLPEALEQVFGMKVVYDYTVIAVLCPIITFMVLLAVCAWQVWDEDDDDEDYSAEGAFIMILSIVVSLFLIVAVIHTGADICQITLLHLINNGGL